MGDVPPLTTRGGHRPPDATRAVLLILAAALCLAFAALIVLDGRLADQEKQIRVACRGVIASLDLTEWVELCRQAR